MYVCTLFFKLLCGFVSYDKLESYYYYDNTAYSRVKKKCAFAFDARARWPRVHVQKTPLRFENYLHI